MENAPTSEQVVQISVTVFSGITAAPGDQLPQFSHKAEFSPIMLEGIVAHFTDLFTSGFLLGGQLPQYF